MIMKLIEREEFISDWIETKLGKDCDGGDRSLEIGQGQCRSHLSHYIYGLFPVFIFDIREYYCELKIYWTHYKSLVTFLEGVSSLCN